MNKASSYYMVLGGKKIFVEFLNIKMKMKKGTVGLLVVVLVLVAGFWGYNQGWFDNVFSATGGADDDSEALPTGYVPHALTSGFKIKVYNAEDTDATFGANDVYGKIWNPGTADWTGAFVEKSTTFTTSTATVDFTGASIYTGKTYDVVLYQGDGGTSLYPETLTITIPKLDSEITTLTYADTVFLFPEGSFSESACDSSTDAFDESTDTVTLNKTAQTVQGSLTWDCTFGQATAGAVLEDPIILFREKPGSELTDINDIEHVYVSIKTGGSGLTIPSGDLVSEFRAGVPLSVGIDKLRSSNNAVLTVEFDLPASESDVGTGTFQMIFDDLGDYRAKANIFGTSDYDTHASAEITDFVITA